MTETSIKAMTLSEAQERVEELEQQLAAANAELDRVRSALDYKTAYMEWEDKTHFIQEWMNSGMLPAKYLGLHRADVMRELLEQSQTTSPAAEPVRNIEITRKMIMAGEIARQEADTYDMMKAFEIGLRAALGAAQPAPATEPVESWEQTVNRIVPDFPDYAASHPASATWAVWTDRNRIREALLKLKPAPVAQSEAVKSKVIAYLQGHRFFYEFGQKHTNNCGDYVPYAKVLEALDAQSREQEKGQ